MNLPTLKCNRCGHEWHPRTDKKPKVCSKCASPYWDSKRIRPVKPK